MHACRSTLEDPTLIASFARGPVPANLNDPPPGGTTVVTGNSFTYAALIAANTPRRPNVQLNTTFVTAIGNYLEVGEFTLAHKALTVPRRIDFNVGQRFA